MTTEDRLPLSREFIAQTALELTEDVGLEGLSMRKLGAELGVEAMSLYHYVANKDDLLDAMLDLLYREIDLPFDIADDQWEVSLRQGLRAFNDVLMAHPGAVELFIARAPTSEAASKTMYWAYQRFELQGLTPSESSAAFRFAVSFVIGNAARQSSGEAIVYTDEGLEGLGVTDPEYRGFLVEHGKLSGEELFEVGLDIVVAGLRAIYKRLP